METCLCDVVSFTAWELSLPIFSILNFEKIDSTGYCLICMADKTNIGSCCGQVCGV